VKEQRSIDTINQFLAYFTKRQDIPPSLMKLTFTQCGKKKGQISLFGQHE
jgi:hypothetical protein